MPIRNCREGHPDRRRIKSKIVQARPLADRRPLQRCPDISLARDKLQWGTPVPLDQGLAKTIEYFRWAAAQQQPGDRRVGRWLPSNFFFRRRGGAPEMGRRGAAAVEIQELSDVGIGRISTGGFPRYSGQWRCADSADRAASPMMGGSDHLLRRHCARQGIDHRSAARGHFVVDPLVGFSMPSSRRMEGAHRADS